MALNLVILSKKLHLYRHGIIIYQNLTIKRHYCPGKIGYSCANKAVTQSLPTLPSKDASFVSRDVTFSNISRHFYSLYNKAEYVRHPRNIPISTSKGYKTQTDAEYMAAFEDQSLPFEEWTHEAHIRMAWKYITKYGVDKARPLVSQGIQKYNAVNQDKVERGYHETITQFYIHMIDLAVKTGGIDATFDDFLQNNAHLLRRDLIFDYYRSDCILSEKAKKELMLPDRKELPTYLSQ